MMDKEPLWRLLLAAGILVLEWWLPRQSKFRANSTLDLVGDLFLALAIGALALTFWRKKK